jgi:hypothetical protein
MGSGGAGLTNRSDSAPPLTDVDEQGRYDPYFATAELNTPRYFHVGISGQNGFPVIFGGSDERGLSGLDTIEMYDQSTFSPNRPKPESGSGLWINTNFEGDPIAFENGPRILHTATRLSDGRILIVGGAPDFIASQPYNKGEIFDPETRTFETVESDMITARFRHSAITLSDGSILIVGGQIVNTVTLFDPQVLPGQVPIQIQVTVFSSYPFSEIFSPTTQEFLELTIQDTETESKLNTPRGRAGHDMARLAGPDRTLRSSDDVFVLAGGMQTLSGQFAPRTKFYGSAGRFEASGLSVIEFFDPVTDVFTQVSNVSLTQPRLNNPYLMNLGQFNDFTIDGVRGMGNLILITHGNIDSDCPTTPLIDELIMANYTGFGPAQGLQFFMIDDGLTGGHSQAIEHAPPPPPPIDPHGGFVGRSATNPVPLVRRMEAVNGVKNEQTWIMAVAGVDIFPTPAGCAYNSTSPTMIAGCVFDPYFSLPAALLNFSPRNLQSQRSENNPLGVIGTWLTLDGPSDLDPAISNIPTITLDGFGEPVPPARWARMTAPGRIFCFNLPTAGVDGLINTFDDRVILIGGGDSYDLFGGEPSAPSSEVLIVPFSTIKQPTP